MVCRLHLREQEPQYRTHEIVIFKIHGRNSEFYIEYGGYPHGSKDYLRRGPILSAQQQTTRRKTLGVYRDILFFTQLILDTTRESNHQPIQPEALESYQSRTNA